MPSGAKRRRAAKKKRENQLHLDSPTNSSVGNGGIDEILTSPRGGGRESCDEFQGETGSPSSSESKENNYSRDGSLVEGTSEGVSSDLDSIAHPCADIDSTASVIDITMEGPDSGVGENKEITISEGNGISQGEEVVILSSVPPPISENEKISIEHVQSSEKVHSSSSSDDGDSSDSGSEERSQIKSIENPSEEELGNLVDSVPVESPVNQPVPVVSLCQEETGAVEVPVDSSGVLDVVSSLKESEEILVSSSVDVQQIAETVSPGTAKDLEESVQCCKDSVEPEIPEPEIILAPQTERRASWRNCCGLLDVIMGSHR